MGETASGPPRSADPLEDRLDSWKEIAAYLNRDVTTVQRWEKREGMPVRRHLHDRIGSVYASRAELDVWVRSRNLGLAQEADNQAGQANPSSSKPTTTLTSSTTWKYLFLLALVAALAVGISIWMSRTEYFWRNPLAGARFQTVTDFDGVEQAAAISRDGQFLAFLSDRDGHQDVWVTQVGSGQFHNLTRGGMGELVNPSVRTLGFTPDGAFVTFWTRKQEGSSGSDISVWAVPTLGGQPKPYLEGVAEYAWSRDSARLAYHTPGPGDPLFVSDGSPNAPGQPIFTAPVGLHCHFPLWSPDGAFLVSAIPEGKRKTPATAFVSSARAPGQMMAVAAGKHGMS